MSELQRKSEALLRQRGYLTASVERRKLFPAAKSQPCKACGSRQMIDISVDMFNVFDLICFQREKRHIVLVQVTSAAHHADRRNKIIASSEARLCLLTGAFILIQSWRKKDNRWVAMDEWISLDQFVFGLPDSVEQFYEDQARKKLLERDLPPSRTLPLALIPDSEMPFLDA